MVSGSTLMSWPGPDKVEKDNTAMSESIPTFQYYSNRYHAAAACEHCEGIIRHENWCITRDPIVYYAYQIVADPTQLTIGDALILHTLGVTWERNKSQVGCRGNCSAGSRIQA